MSYFGTIYADTELPSRARAVYMYLRDRADSEGKCWPGIKTIASDMRLSRSTVKRALTDLEQHGYLQKIPRRANGDDALGAFRARRDGRHAQHHRQCEQKSSKLFHCVSNLLCCFFLNELSGNGRFLRTRQMNKLTWTDRPSLRRPSTRRRIQTASARPRWKRRRRRPPQSARR